MGKKHVCIFYTGESNVYIEGRISGAMSAITKETRRKTIPYAICEVSTGGKVFQADMTKRQYKKLCAFVEDWYPSMCMFEDWKTAARVR